MYIGLDGCRSRTKCKGVLQESLIRLHSWYCFVTLSEIITRPYGPNPVCSRHKRSKVELPSPCGQNYSDFYSLSLYESNYNIRKRCLPCSCLRYLNVKTIIERPPRADDNSRYYYRYRLYGFLYYELRKCKKKQFHCVFNRTKSVWKKIFI